MSRPRPGRAPSAELAARVCAAAAFSDDGPIGSPGSGADPLAPALAPVFSKLYARLPRDWRSDFTDDARATLLLALRRSKLPPELRARLELWFRPWPGERFGSERELESARRRLALGDFSGLWDGLTLCARGRWYMNRGLAPPPWLRTALFAAIESMPGSSPSEELSRLAEAIADEPLAAEPFSALSAGVLGFLRGVRLSGAPRGRHSRWWARWGQDQLDAERADAIEALATHYRAQALENLAHYEEIGADRRPELQEERDWQAFVLDSTRWTEGRIAEAAALDVPWSPARSPSGAHLHPPSRRTMLGSLHRYRETSLREPWRFAYGPLGQARHDELDRERQEHWRRERAEGSGRAGAFLAWKADRHRERWRRR